MTISAFGRDVQLWYNTIVDYENLRSAFPV